MDEDKAPGEAESAETKPEPLTIHTAYEKALADSEEKGEAEPKESAKPAPEKPAVSEEEAEHIRWVKKVEGLTDKETGQINVDRLAKQLFEMNKGFQTKAQQLNQINQLLADPEVKAAVERKLSGKAPEEKPKQKDETEKTDEEILREFVDERAKAIAEERLKPILSQQQAVFQKFIKDQSEEAGHKMIEDYGKEEFEAMWPDIYQTVSDAATAQNRQPAELVRDLIVNGVWLQTMQNIANNLVAPKLRSQLAELKTQKESKELEQKKKTRLTPKGTSEKSVKENIKVRSIRDAARAAEADHPEFAELK